MTITIMTAAMYQPVLLFFIGMFSVDILVFTFNKTKITTIGVREDSGLNLCDCVDAVTKSVKNWIIHLNRQIPSLKIKKRLTAETVYRYQLERNCLPNLGIFRKPKKEEESKLEEEPTKTPNVTPQPASETSPTENKEPEAKAYLKAMPLRDLADLENIKTEVNNGNIIILKITPLANKNILDVSTAVNELNAFAEEIGGDIARLGEERVVICPPKIRIWREKTPSQSEPLPTAA